MPISLGTKVIPPTIIYTTAKKIWGYNKCTHTTFIHPQCMVILVYYWLLITSHFAWRYGKSSEAMNRWQNGVFDAIVWRSNFHKIMQHMAHALACSIYFCVKKTAELNFRNVCTNSDFWLWGPLNERSTWRRFFEEEQEDIREKTLIPNLELVSLHKIITILFVWGKSDYPY